MLSKHVKCSVWCTYAALTTTQQGDYYNPVLQLENWSWGGVTYSWPHLPSAKNSVEKQENPAFISQSLSHCTAQACHAQTEETGAHPTVPRWTLKYSRRAKECMHRALLPSKVVLTSKQTCMDCANTWSLHSHMDFFKDWSNTYCEVVYSLREFPYLHYCSFWMFHL